MSTCPTCGSHTRSVRGVSQKLCSPPIIVKCSDPWHEAKPTNQCDGCKQKLPTHNGIHYKDGVPWGVCTKDRYDA